MSREYFALGLLTGGYMSGGICPCPGVFVHVRWYMYKGYMS